MESGAAPTPSQISAKCAEQFAASAQGGDAASRVALHELLQQTAQLGRLNFNSTQFHLR